MCTCDQFRPLLYRVAEGESTPEEAMLVARHLPECTTCKILQAREHRLATWLESGLQDLPVGEDFVHDVMAKLPDGPPPRPRRRPWRLLKMTGFGRQKAG